MLSTVIQCQLSSLGRFFNNWCQAHNLFCTQRVLMFDMRLHFLPVPVETQLCDWVVAGLNPYPDGSEHVECPLLLYPWSAHEQGARMAVSPSTVDGRKRPCLNWWLRCVFLSSLSSDVCCCCCCGSTVKCRSKSCPAGSLWAAIS